ncbi:ferredoxin reductase [Nonomuraea gerenzanensis]|uniref:Flavodoxin reductases (Ferredoxin-NADPH reductases) family 1 n=1 Tax=Nonomuraea gerenzanensis TaxID=93944 RepID=A0A1M4DWR0_9ACTN|nr:ferredoxin reductase [Nonomuraea gerenzanensis]UBU13337.1 ferredoxin reductase [Nonomuraea gerenzanensis]SBO90993.1 Flavodoxin reductases (ferredoxin-NADPH reductases) family 1 [Nonomuraea gerenzanensis]
MRRLAWRPAELVHAAAETETARTLRLRVPDWPGHLAGQHVDVRLTAEDGYTAQRSYSVAGPADGDLIELTVETVQDGEVSPYLTEEMRVGDQVEIRGPVGGWFVWRPESRAPVLLVGGGSGIVPLMAMIRTRRQAGSRVPFRLLYSVRDPGRRYYAEELRRPEPGLDVSYLYTRSAPEGLSRPARRIMLDDLAEGGWPASFEPDCYVCGPTGFVEAAADLLLALGHAPERIRTERFGPTGG